MNKYLVTYQSPATHTQVVKTVTADYFEAGDVFVAFKSKVGSSCTLFLVPTPLLESVELLPADEPAPSEQATA